MKKTEQWWVEQGMLPFLLYHNVSHKIIERSTLMMNIEVAVNGVAMMNYTRAVEEYTKEKINSLNQNVAA